VIRVAIADDSRFTCNLLASYIEADGECSVVGVAHDARSTLELVRRVSPDVVTLDLLMPGADGLDLLRELSADGPPVSVVVISGVTRLAAATTLRALELGAVDFVLKYTPGAPVSRASLRREIVAKVKLAAAARGARRLASIGVAAMAAPAGAAPVRPVPRATSRAATGADATGVIVIGASTGGPRAVSELLNQLPADFAIPCVVVQHLPAAFTAAFASQLERHAQLRVRVAESGDRLEPGVVLLAPGAMHLAIRPDGRVVLRQPSERDVYKPSIDLAMTSAADAYAASAVGVVLSGSGDDGAEGLKRLRAAGGEGMVQDVDSCIVASMPERALARAGAEHVGPPARLGRILAVRRKS
jgi:two-component system chemotaxis response regulator CheB